jgi:hypothetical protein
MPVCREKNGKYKKCNDKEDLKSSPKGNGLTDKQNANLPPALKKAILEKMKGK